MKTVFLTGLLTLGAAANAFAQPTNRPETSTVRRVPNLNSRTDVAPPANSIGAAMLATTIKNAERAQDADSLLLAYGQAVTDPQLARAALSQLLDSYYKLRNQAQTADQAIQAISEASLRFQVLQSAQNQVLIQQNQQILNQNARLIELMEAQSRAR